MANSFLNSALKPLQHLNDSVSRKPFDYNQTSTSNGLPDNFPGGPIQGPSIKGIEFSYNHQAYSVEVTLNNLIASEVQIVKPDSIIDLTINDTLINWITKGTLTLRNTFNTIENNYSFRNDGYDTLTIRIYPTTPNALVPTVVNVKTGMAATNYEQKDWELNYIFSIFKVEDIPLVPGAEGAASVSIKAKKLHFRDLRYHLLSTKTMQYSTALSPKVGNVTANSTDEQRSLPTGDIIKEIIQDGINDSALSRVSTDNADWDLGATKLFFTAPADYTAFDSLMDVYHRHVSTISNGGIHDFCILTIDRGPGFGDKGQFTLKPLSKYFERAGKSVDAPGEYLIENFFLQTPDDTPNVKKVGKRRTPLKKTYTSYSRISHYEYLEISPDTNANFFITKPVYSFDLGKREFNIEFNNNNVTTAKNFINERYISQLLTANASKDNFHVTLDSTKKDLNIKPVFSLYGTDGKVAREPDGILNLLKIGVFQNTCITFTVPGLTSREAGRFIGIDYFNGSLNSKFDDKLCGQWFIIDIKHIFRGATYNNEITAIKLHKYENTDKFPNTL
jgi:hypothetical protein